MTQQDYEDIRILRHAVNDIRRDIEQLLNEPSFDDMDCVELVEKGKQIKRIAEIISAIRDGGKHLPFEEDEE